MSESLKDKTAKGLLWGGISNGIQQLLNLFFGIFLARLLTPDDYGMVGMLSFFTAIAGTLQEGGFIAALTNRKDANHKDYNAVFWFSSCISIMLYIILYFCAPLIAKFFNQPELIPLSRLSFLGFVIASISIAPYAFLFKNLRVKESAIISLTALSISGIIGITLAYNGFSYWGIVGQSLTFITVVTTLRFYYSKWRPSFSFNITPIKEMLGFSSKLIITNIFNIINANLFSVLFGKIYGEKEVGFFNQANKWNNMGHSIISGMINGVAQPMFTTLCDDKKRQLNALRKMIRFTAFISFPTLFGLNFIAEEFIIIAITDKWLYSAYIMEILCIGGAFMPLNSLLANLIISRGHSSIHMWNTILLNLTQLIAALIIFPYGIERILYIFVAINISWLLIWTYFVWRDIGLTLPALIKDISPYLLLTYFIITGTSYLTIYIDNILLRLISKIVIVASVYISVLWLLKSTILQETISYIFKKKAS